MCDHAKKHVYICYECEEISEQPKECCGQAMTKMTD